MGVHVALRCFVVGVELFLDPLLAGFALDLLPFALFGVCYPFVLLFCFRSMYFLVSLRLKSVVL
jgi:hypothetical protein